MFGCACSLQPSMIFVLEILIFFAGMQIVSEFVPIKKKSTALKSPGLSF